MSCNQKKISETSFINAHFKLEWMVWDKRYFHSLFIWVELAKMCPFRMVSTLKIRAEKLLLYPSISRGQSGRVLWAPAHQSINVKEEIEGIALNSGSLHSHLLNSYLPSVRRWHRPNSVSAHKASTSSSALSPPTPPAGKKDGHSAGWLSGPLCPPNIPQSLLPQFPPLTRGFAFHFPFDVSHSAEDLLLICVTEST